MQIMALRVFREVAENIHDVNFYLIMCDEATDAKNVSELVVCLHWMDDELETHDVQCVIYILILEWQTRLDELSMVDVANDFLFVIDHRKTLFGRFDDVDLRRKSIPVKSVRIQMNINN